MLNILMISTSIIYNRYTIHYLVIISSLDDLKINIIKYLNMSNLQISIIIGYYKKIKI